MKIKCLLSGHIWQTVSRELDPMKLSPGTFSNYVNTVYTCYCIREGCGAMEKNVKTRHIPEGSQELQNRKAWALSRVSVTG